MTLSQKFIDFLVEEALSLRETAEDVARSGAYLYPVKGIIYFSYHKSLWRPLLSRSSQILTLGMGVTGTMFFFTYLPQLAIMSITSGPLAPISAALLVLSESSAVTTFLSTASLEEGMVDTFDGALVSRGQESLVAQGRTINPNASGDHIARLGKKLKKPLARLRPRALLRSLILLPLNFVPVIGTFMYAIAHGKKRGPAAHARYFQLKGWNEDQSEAFIKKNRAAYTGLGVASFALEMVPFASIIFSFTNSVGAALWAADMEKALQ
ncbi:hypothetical protein ASPWEDRAFT_49113 [Aspergillus wentii DTO 134E9]|uniref:Outer spore wall protein RRT8 n=1 Tax=Aspergillus wentii DTO 134E9 TaxID=1073089 RepID=A0A1L9RVT2_ASPWE|nr:uncharacterized protein ASPWEDRAFT_49113 [Aspergillus wentii DTO 134E9]KAI9929260.1 hypothetical protein MW887_001668 [Aspergillus wentii]OJJ39036.1 hypothetical protein ASPWEDRAFT_49113 [Aspergillus wentii DTO 134E9]